MIKIKKHMLIITLSLMLMISNTMMVSSENITARPETINIYMTGGDNTTINLTIRFPCSNPTSFNITTDITPGPQGFNITYIYIFPETIIQNQGYNIQMQINTTINLSPGIYNITSIFYCDCDETTNNGDNNDDEGWKTGFITWSPKQDYILPDQPDNDKPSDDDTLLKQPHVIYVPRENNHKQNNIFLPFIILIYILLVIVLLYRRRMEVKHK